MKEDRETGNYMRSYMVLDFSIHKLRLYPAEAEVSRLYLTTFPGLPALLSGHTKKKSEGLVSLVA